MPGFVSHGTRQAFPEHTLATGIQPLAASDVQIAAPSPREPPVIKATLFLGCNSFRENIFMKIIFSEWSTNIQAR
jgi:hypothetical protein